MDARVQQLAQKDSPQVSLTEQDCQLLETLYAATQTHGGWITFMNALAKRMNAWNVTITTEHVGSREVVMRVHGGKPFDEALTTEYFEKYHGKDDPVGQLLDGKADGEFYCTDLHLTEKQKETPFWQHWARPQGLEHGAAGYMNTVGNHRHLVFLRFLNGFAQDITLTEARCLGLEF